jgi:hypothetical protein
VTVSLGGISLSEHLALDIQGAGLAYSQRRLIGGASVVQADGAFGGRVVTLSGDNHWTLAQVEQIQAMQALALPVEMIHHRGTFSVLITDTTNLEPAFGYADPDLDDWYTGHITMIEVSS